MRGLLGLVVVAAIAVAFYYFYFEKTQPDGGSGTGAAIAAISTTGVKNDLIAIANAQRMYVSTNGRYATMDELISSGELRMEKPQRENYVYTVEVSGSGFTATARYTGPAPGNHPTLTIDQTMQIRESP